MPFNHSVKLRYFAFLFLLLAWIGCGSEPVVDHESDGNQPSPARLSGSVLSSAGGHLSLAALRIVYAGGVLDTLTAEDGTFVFENAPTDIPLTIEASAVAHDTTTQDIPPLKAGETRQLTLTLKVTPKETVIPTGTEVGDRAPDFTLPDMNGSAVTLSDFRGKSAVLLTFHRGKF